MSANEDVIGGVAVGTRSDLYKLLYKNLPKHRSGKYGQKLSGKKIGDDCGVSYQSVYRWFDQDRLPAKQVKKLTELKGSSLKVEDLLPFVI